MTRRWKIRVCWTYTMKWGAEQYRCYMASSGRGPLRGCDHSVVADTRDRADAAAIQEHRANCKRELG